MLQASGLGYGARVYQAPEMDPNSENGPIRRASGALVRVTDPPRMVQRSPHAVVREGESGAVYNDPPVWEDKFLPDGRLVPMHALGATAAQPADALSAATHLWWFSILSLGVVGCAVGALKTPRTSWTRVGVTGVAGLIAGAATAGIVTRSAVLASTLRKG